jgi:hypothetical protein
VLLAIYISNHGGRVLDGAPTAAEVLLAIRKNAPDVFAKVEVYADGGVRRGTDVIKLLALGARAVGVGRRAVVLRERVWAAERRARDRAAAHRARDEHAAHGRGGRRLRCWERFIRACCRPSVLHPAQADCCAHVNTWLLEQMWIS